MKRETYRQVLPELELSLERYTKDVPDDGAWYLLRSGEHLGRFRTLKEARDAWKQVLAKDGWEEPQSRINARDALMRESKERWARNRGG